MTKETDPLDVLSIAGVIVFALALAGTCWAVLGCAVRNRDYAGVRAGAEVRLPVIGTIAAANFEVRESRGVHHATTTRSAFPGDGYERLYLDVQRGGPRSSGGGF